VRRGCISLGNINCSQCGRAILYPERYLLVEKEGKNQTMCMDCCQKKKLVKPENDKEGAELLFDLSDE
jgi:hypothetical protein